MWLEVEESSISYLILGYATGSLDGFCFVGEKTFAFVQHPSTLIL